MHSTFTAAAAGVGERCSSIIPGRIRESSRCCTQPSAQTYNNKNNNFTLYSHHPIS